MSHQTIYNWIDRHEPSWREWLRRRGRPPEKRGKLRDCVSIPGRPKVINRRRRYGDWEGERMKLAFLELAPGERRLYIEQAAARRDISPVILEKDFWVCWLLAVLFESEFADSLVFKGGTSLSKVFGVTASTRASSKSK